MPQYQPEMTQVTAQAPATLSNLAVGFDLLGVALEGPVDTVQLTKRSDSRLTIAAIESDDQLPIEVDQNTVTIALRSVLQAQGDSQGFDVSIRKGIDCGSGMGGSAASSVAALVAYNGFLKQPLTRYELLSHAIKAELAVSGGLCVENPAAALWGGLVLCPNENTVLSLPSPIGRLLTAKPAIVVNTKAARALLPQRVTLEDCTQRCGRCAAWVAAVYQHQWPMAAQLMQDDIVEPARAQLWPHYDLIRSFGLKLGAWSVCISGSGPTVLLWVPLNLAPRIQQELTHFCAKQGFPIHSKVSSWQAPAAKVLGVE